MQSSEAGGYLESLSIKEETGETGAGFLEDAGLQTGYRLGVRGSPGGSELKHPLASAGDTGSIPDPERFRMPQSNQARVSQLLSLCPRAREPQLSKPTHPTAYAAQQETPPQ